MGKTSRIAMEFRRRVRLSRAVAAGSVGIGDRPPDNGEWHLVNLNAKTENDLPFPGSWQHIYPQ